MSMVGELKPNPLCGSELRSVLQSLKPTPDKTRQRLEQSIKENKRAAQKAKLERMKSKLAEIDRQETVSRPCVLLNKRGRK